MMGLFCCLAGRVPVFLAALVMTEMQEGVDKRMDVSHGDEKGGMKDGRTMEDSV